MRWSKEGRRGVPGATSREGTMATHAHVVASNHEDLTGSKIRSANIIMYENHMIHMHPRCTHIHETSAASPSKPESKKKGGGWKATK